MTNKDIIISYKKLSKQLKAEYHYSESQVIHTVWRLLTASPEVKQAFADWYLRSKDVHLKCEGVSWNDLVKIKGLNPFNAFLFMDTMLKDPSLGINILATPILPCGATRQIRVEDLRPDLREYVEGKLSEAAQEENALKESLLKNGDEIDFSESVE